MFKEETFQLSIHYLYLNNNIYNTGLLKMIVGVLTTCHTQYDLRGGVFLEKVSRSYKRKRDILLGTWNVRSLYRAGSLMAAARELARYKLDLVGVQEVRWDKEGTVKAGDYSFFSMGKKMKIISWEQGFLYITE